ncbi:hypothetical protein [Hydrogenophaga sp.]|uniref:hypothetical protein n=1 Tax=Hydrogenophaga sp. TaxID=1904254 RepID=UPI003D2B1047
MSISAPPIRMMRPCTVRESTRVCVWMRRATRLSATASGFAAATPLAAPCTVRVSSQVITPMSSNVVRRSAQVSQPMPCGACCHAMLSASNCSSR